MESMHQVLRQKSPIDVPPATVHTATLFTIINTIKNKNKNIKHVRSIDVVNKYTQFGYLIERHI